MRCLPVIRSAILALPFLITSSAFTEDETVSLDEKLHHLRAGDQREWSSFPETAEGRQRTVSFESPESNFAEWTLRLRQQDVKQNWEVVLNGKTLGRLERDENDMAIVLPIPKDMIQKGKNVLEVRPKTDRVKTPDDIRAGEIRLIKKSVKEFLGQAALEVTVIDKDTSQPTPARITITDGEGTLQTIGAVSNDHLAVRPGTVYTSTGKAKVPLPAGDYMIYAGRGFEYSLTRRKIQLTPGSPVPLTLEIRREVPTAGWVACDTHVHTLTHSGHGDCSVQERMITLAAEGIELPIATDHNVQIDHRSFAKAAHVSQFFTPVIGNEVTTPVGHFNVFPAEPDAKVPDHRLNDWGPILDEIYKTPGVKIAILNHARDLHRGVRPFGPKHFNEAVGVNFDGWPMRFNAMEVVNSSATQNQPLELCEDWMTLLNAGYSIAPIGSSDSHDVARHFVGQSRTYIRCDDENPGAIDVGAAVDSILGGRVRVSYGLLVELVVDGKYISGELAMLTGRDVKLEIRVLAPHWIKADRLRLYANGEVIHEQEIPNRNPDLPRGVCWRGELKIPRANYDQHLVAIATGPGIEAGYWKTAKPYQPTSPEWNPQVIGCSGAVWFDGDGDGRRSSARDYATRAWAKSQGKLVALLQELDENDSAVAAQAAHLYQSAGNTLFSQDAQRALNQAPDNVKRGFRDYLKAWRETEIARSQAR